MLRKKPRIVPESGAAGPIGLLVVLWLLAYLLPSALIGTNEGKYVSLERSLAVDYLAASRIYTGKTSDRLWALSRKIISFEQKAESCASDGEGPMSDYVMRLRLYTFVGIPYKTLTITCGGRKIAE